VWASLGEIKEQMNFPVNYINMRISQIKELIACVSEEQCGADKVQVKCIMILMLNKEEGTRNLFHVRPFIFHKPLRLSPFFSLSPSHHLLQCMNASQKLGEKRVYKGRNHAGLMESLVHKL
jgi:hypothetical protein